MDKATNKEIIYLDKTNAGPFAPYLLPMAREAISAEDKDFVAVGVIEGNFSLGAAAAEIRNGVVKIISIYVDKSARRQGVGTLLLSGIATAVLQKDVYLDSVVVDYMVEDEDNKVISAFLMARGFEEPQVSHRIFSVNTAKLHRIPFIGSAFTSNFKDDEHIRAFGEITPEQLREIEEDDSVLQGLKPSALRHGILKRGATIWVEDGHVLAWIIGYRGFDGGIVLSAACKREGAPKGSFRKLLLSSANRCYMMLGHDFDCYISTINEHAGSLVEKIAAGEQKEFAHYRAELLTDFSFEEDDEEFDEDETDNEADEE